MTYQIERFSHVPVMYTIYREVFYGLIVSLVTGRFHFIRERVCVSTVTAFAGGAEILGTGFFIFSILYFAGGSIFGFYASINVIVRQCLDLKFRMFNDS